MKQSALQQLGFRGFSPVEPLWSFLAVCIRHVAPVCMHLFVVGIAWGRVSEAVEPGLINPHLSCTVRTLMHRTRQFRYT